MIASTDKDSEVSKSQEEYDAGEHINIVHIEEPQANLAHVSATTNISHYIGDPHNIHNWLVDSEPPVT